MLIIAGTIAMIGGHIMQTDAPVQDAFCQNDWPYLDLPSFLGALISIAGLNIGESIMVPRFGAALATEKLLPEGLGKTNSKNAPVIAIIISGIFAFLLLLSLDLSNPLQLSVLFSVSSIHSNCFGSHQTQKNVPRQKGYTFRVPFGSVIPIFGCYRQHPHDCWSQHDEFCLWCHRSHDCKWTLLCFPR